MTPHNYDEILKETMKRYLHEGNYEVIKMRRIFGKIYITIKENKNGRILGNSSRELGGVIDGGRDYYSDISYSLQKDTDRSGTDGKS